METSRGRESVRADGIRACRAPQAVARRQTTTHGGLAREGEAAIVSSDTSIRPLSDEVMHGFARTRRLSKRSCRIVEATTGSSRPACPGRPFVDGRVSCCSVTAVCQAAGAEDAQQTAKGQAHTSPPLSNEAGYDLDGPRAALLARNTRVAEDHHDLRMRLVADESAFSSAQTRAQRAEDT